MIELHNDRNESKNFRRILARKTFSKLLNLFTERFMRELKNLKLDLLSDLPRAKKVRPPTPDPEEVERRLVQEGELLDLYAATYILRCCLT